MTLQSVFLARHTEASQLTKLKQGKFVALLCLGGAVGLTLSLTGCSVAPEPHVAHLPSAVALAKVRLDPVAATAKLNAYRAEKGLNSLRLDPALTAMAEQQAQAMAASGTMSHEVAGAFSSRLAASGIKSTAGENQIEPHGRVDDCQNYHLGEFRSQWRFKFQPSRTGLVRSNLELYTTI